MGLGFTEILVIGAVFVLFFGARHLPALLGSLGRAPREFKKGLKGTDEERPVRDVDPLNNTPDKK